MRLNQSLELRSRLSVKREPVNISGKGESTRSGWLDDLFSVEHPPPTAMAAPLCFQFQNTFSSKSLESRLSVLQSQCFQLNGVPIP